MVMDSAYSSNRSLRGNDRPGIDPEGESRDDFSRIIINRTDEKHGGLFSGLVWGCWLCEFNI